MASQVLSGTGNVSYTNNTGQNVRVVINYMALNSTSTLSWAGVSLSSGTASAIGRNLAFNVGGGSGNLSANNMSIADGSESANISLPTEIMLASGQTFSTSNTGAYNIVVIPEAG